MEWIKIEGNEHTLPDFGTFIVHRRGLSDYDVFLMDKCNSTQYEIFGIGRRINAWQMKDEFDYWMAIPEIPE